MAYNRVEGVDQLDGHPLHNHDQKTHCQALARFVHGLDMAFKLQHRRNHHGTRTLADGLDGLRPLVALSTSNVHNPMS